MPLSEENDGSSLFSVCKGSWAHGYTFSGESLLNSLGFKVVRVICRPRLDYISGRASSSPLASSVFLPHPVQQADPVLPHPVRCLHSIGTIGSSPVHSQVHSPLLQGKKLPTRPTLPLLPARRLDMSSITIQHLRIQMAIRFSTLTSGLRWIISRASTYASRLGSRSG